MEDLAAGPVGKSELSSSAEADVLDLVAAYA